MESTIDLAAVMEHDRRAREQDTSTLDKILLESSRNESRLSELLSLQQSHHEELAELKDLLYLCVRQIKVVPRGKPERLFYEATAKKMNSLSGGIIIPEAPNWIVSHLEVDFGEGTFFFCSVVLHRLLIVVYSL
jgi:hypothetical protein